MANLTPSLRTNDTLMVDLSPKPPYERTIIRTPSPTPSEQFALSGKKRKLSDLFTKENWKLLIVIVVIITIVVLMFVFNDQIVHALKPAAKWMHDTPGGWLIPIAVLIVLSFPPLIGHEIVLILVGFTWGLGPGFGIASAGTYFGEVATFYTFKYFCKARGAKMELSNISYATLARVIREGGLPVAIVARYSTIPTHLLTAIFSACGMTFTNFTISAIVSLPRQFVTIYIGYALQQSGDGKQTKTSKIVQYVSIGVTIFVTIRAMRYLDAKRAAVTPEIVYARRKRRQAKLQAEADLAYTSPSALESGLSISPVRPENRPSGSIIHAPRPSYGQSRSTDVLFPQPTYYPTRSG